MIEALAGWPKTRGLPAHSSSGDRDASSFRALPERDHAAGRDADVYRGLDLIADLSDYQGHAAEQNGAKVYEDVQFYPVSPLGNPFSELGVDKGYWRRAEAQPAAMAQMALAFVRLANQTDGRCHGPPQCAQGLGQEGPREQGVTVGIVDTGITSALQEFSAARRSPFSLSFVYSSGAWTDTVGHGSMCAALPPRQPAAAAVMTGSRRRRAARADRDEQQLRPVRVQRTGRTRRSALGTVNWDGRRNCGEHGNSSRGPGEWASAHKKPDVVAPPYVLWGGSTRLWSGGSAAAPDRRWLVWRRSS